MKAKTTRGLLAIAVLAPFFGGCNDSNSNDSNQGSGSLEGYYRKLDVDKAITGTVELREKQSSGGSQSAVYELVAHYDDAGVPAGIHVGTEVVANWALIEIQDDPKVTPHTIQVNEVAVRDAVEEIEDEWTRNNTREMVGKEIEQLNESFKDVEIELNDNGFTISNANILTSMNSYVQISKDVAIQEAAAGIKRVKTRLANERVDEITWESNKTAELIDELEGELAAELEKDPADQDADRIEQIKTNIRANEGRADELTREKMALQKEIQSLK